MLTIQWGTLAYQLLFLLLMIGVPIAIVVRLIKGRKNKIKELEQRIEKLEREK